MYTILKRSNKNNTNNIIQYIYINTQYLTIITIPKITDSRKRQASHVARRARQSFSKGTSKLKIPRDPGHS